MRILIAIAQAPFLRRATETLAEDLSTALRRRGNRAEIVRIPFSWKTPEDLLDQIVATRLMDWTGSEGSLGDLLIALEFPAYLIPHPRKVLWLAHDRARLGIELEAASGDDDTAAMETARQARTNADRKYLPEVARRFAVSAGVAAGLKSRCGIDATPLYPPPRSPESLAWNRPEDYLLVPPGLSPLRIELVLQALAASSSPLRVKHCGQLDRRIERGLRDTAERLRVDDRVEWLGELPDATVGRLYGTSFAVLYPALDESLGWVALHAGLASKAVIVCADSGAPAELVRHEQSGAVVAPEPAAVAAAIDDLWSRPERTAVWGRAGRARAVVSAFDWSHVIGELLSPGVIALAAGGGH